MNSEEGTHEEGTHEEGTHKGCPYDFVATYVPIR
jgi:hypothetical protein